MSLTLLTADLQKTQNPLSPFPTDSQGYLKPTVDLSTASPLASLPHWYMQLKHFP